MTKKIKRMLFLLFMVTLIFSSNSFASAQNSPRALDAKSSIASNGVYGNVNNDISIPLTEYPAHQGTNWNMPLPAASRFTNSDGSCRQYAYSNECDGFARYAHDRFWHLDSSNWGTTWPSSSEDYFGKIDWNNNSTLTESLKQANILIVKNFFGTLSRGAFIRYGKDNGGVHSIFFNGIDEHGIWAYECNQDAFLDNDPNTHCGVGYQYYTFEHIHANYDHIIYSVNHDIPYLGVMQNATYHIVDCRNCDAFLRQPHTFSSYGAQTRCTGCGYIMLNNMALY